MQLSGAQFSMGINATIGLSGSVTYVYTTDNPHSIGTPSVLATVATTAMQGALDILPHTSSNTSVTVETSWGSFLDIDGGSGWGSIYLTADNRILLHSTGDHGGQNGRPRAISIGPSASTTTEELLFPYARQIAAPGQVWPTQSIITSVSRGNPTILNFSSGHGVLAQHLAYAWPDATVGGLALDITASGADTLSVALAAGYHTPTILNSTQLSIPLDSSALSVYAGGAQIALVKPGYGGYVYDNLVYNYLPNDDVLVRMSWNFGMVFDLATRTFTHGNTVKDAKEWPTGPYARVDWCDVTKASTTNVNGAPGDTGRNSCVGWCEELEIGFVIGGGDIAYPPRTISILEKTGVAAPYWSMRSFSLPTSVTIAGEQLRNLCAVVGKYAYFGGSYLSPGSTFNKKFWRVDLEAVANTTWSLGHVLADSVVTRLADLPDKVALEYTPDGSAEVAWGTPGSYLQQQYTGGYLGYDIDQGVLLYVGRYASYIYRMDSDAWIEVTPLNWNCQKTDISGLYHPPTKAHYVFGYVDNGTLSKIKLNVAGGEWTQTTIGQPFGASSKHTRWLHNPADGRIYQCGGDFGDIPATGPIGTNPTGYPAGEYDENCRQDMYSIDPSVRPFVCRLDQNYWHLNQTGRATDQPGPYHPDEVGWFIDKDGAFWVVQGVERSTGETNPTNVVSPGQYGNGVFGSFIWRKPGWEMRTHYNHYGVASEAAGDAAPKCMAYDAATHSAYCFASSGSVGRAAVRIFNCNLALGPNSNPWSLWESTTQIGFYNPETNTPGIVQMPASHDSKCVMVNRVLYATSFETIGTNIPSDSRAANRLIRWSIQTEEISFSAPLPNNESWDTRFEQKLYNGGGDRCGLFVRGTDIIVCRWYFGEQSVANPAYSTFELETVVPIQPGEVFIFVYDTITNTWSTEDPAPAAMGPNAGCYLPATDEMFMTGYTGFDYDDPVVQSHINWVYKLKP